jgi:aminopeptidase N
MGLHTFHDKQDSQQYIYTQFAPDCCHWLFPCFDQPDLKAVWQFAAVADHDWSVISNEHSVEDGEIEVLVHSVAREMQEVFGVQLTLH